MRSKIWTEWKDIADAIYIILRPRRSKQITTILASGRCISYSSIVDPRVVWEMSCWIFCVQCHLCCLVNAFDSSTAISTGRSRMASASMDAPKVGKDFAHCLKADSIRSRKVLSFKGHTTKKDLICSEICEDIQESIWVCVHMEVGNQNEDRFNKNNSTKHLYKQ